MTWKQQLKSRAVKGLAAATAILTTLSLFPAFALAAINVSVTADSSINLSASDIDLIIKSGSTATSITVGSTNVTVVLDATGSVTITAPDENELVNDAGLSECTRVSGDPSITITYDGSGTDTVIVTPSASLCASGGGGGGGGGGGSSSSSSSTTPTVTVTSPISGNALDGGTTDNIEWNVGGSGVDYVNLYYTFDGGDSYATITTHVDADDEEYEWDIPNIEEEEVVIRAIAYDSGAAKLAQDDSGTFSISLDGTLPEDEPDTSSSTSGEVMARDEANALLPSGVSVDGLVKLPDDGDSATQSDSAVYYVGLDAKRHPYPNSQIFFTWFSDFSSVQEISATDLASMTIGTPILTRPGTLMVKIQTDPKVYAVEPGYVLRWVTSESVALDLYGAAWNTKIMDIEDTYFSKFTFDGDLEAGDAHPSGALVQVSAGDDIYYIDGDEKRLILDDAAFDANYFQSQFVQTNSAGAWVGLTAGDDITEFEDGLFSEQLFN